MKRTYSGLRHPLRAFGRREKGQIFALGAVFMAEVLARGARLIAVPD